MTEQGQQEVIASLEGQDEQGFTLTATLSSTGVCDQYQPERRNVEPQRLFYLGLPATPLGIHPFCRPHGQRGDGSEHAAQLQLESNLHEPSYRSSIGQGP